jgi:hypothetical protein
MGSRGSRVIVHHDQAAWTDSLQEKVLSLDATIQRLETKIQHDLLKLRRKDQKISILRSEIASHILKIPVIPLKEVENASFRQTNRIDQNESSISSSGHIQQL